jgi:uncharacterized membrane protein YccC
LLVRLLNVPEGTWPLITLVVVMGPISFWGNVVPRAFERIGGTILGSALGLVALKLELISLPVMVLWCAVAMFLCGWLALGKNRIRRCSSALRWRWWWARRRGYAHRAMAKRRCYLWFPAGHAVHRHLAAAGVPALANPDGKLRHRLQPSLSGRVLPNLVERPRLEKHLQKVLNDVVKMRGLITPASKETHIQKAIFEAIQTVSRNLVCMLELQINAYWSSRPGHFVMLNAHTLRETQQMTQQTLLTIAHALYEGNPQPIRANTEKLNDIVAELRELMKEHQGDSLAETPIHGYVWLTIELARQLELLSNLICRALRK